MKNITVPTRTVSFEDALRNLASRLTGKPASVLPRTQEGVVQYLADTLPYGGRRAPHVGRWELRGYGYPGARRNRHGGRHGRHGAPQGPQA